MIKPMLASLAKEPFSDPAWIYEIKWDGYRAIANVSDRKVDLYSRNGNSFNDKFPTIVTSLEALGLRAVFDGEVVALNDAGDPSFEMIQNFIRKGEGKLVYVIFDILFSNNQDLRSLPLMERKRILEDLKIEREALQVGGYIEETGEAFFKEIKKHNYEGMVAKLKESPYYSGKRTSFWLKVKNQMRQEVVIGGYTKGQGARTDFGALLMGVFEGEDLIYIGSVGTGFDEQDIEELLGIFKEMEIRESPFKNLSQLRGATWVSSELVAEVKFQEWTQDKKLRQPVFLGLRADKNPTEVVREAI